MRAHNQPARRAEVLNTNGLERVLGINCKGVFYDTLHIQAVVERAKVEGSDHSTDAHIGMVWLPQNEQDFSSSSILMRTFFIAPVCLGKRNLE